ncbi:GLYOXYSOMAL FATTY ACID BETA-OXIDATION MFP-A PROTEIN [Salix koriyanagi]|uniref:GLYOXYSOMAL FATTY ACID BETA-OXIDATION MFP-A PROTEIN n=1 Tax=Salix koriyanagi TaxID=2511006 RepID=A0A9Q0TF76_9ROSI|nr:GLYOXYSOMAL FATTY ACID BETA-OXIDATION MFP-A PROTEIN [Salix koriyanagi]
MRSDNFDSVMFSLKENTEEALQRDDVKAIVITGSNGKFSGGFDVTAFGRKGRTTLLIAGRKPLVAAINGPALGGGLEIALACHARISTSSAQLGLPELRYGILPGFGGTQRLPRLVGIPKALEMMLMSKLVNGYRAQSSGLVDALAATEELVDTARSWALDIYNCKKPWAPSLYRTDKLEPLGEARSMFNFARLLAQKQTPNLRHPLVCIDVIEEGVVSGPRVGLLKESEALLELRQSDTCKSLVHFFFAQRGTAKVPGISDLGLVPRKVNKVAVVGGGLMGSGIATELILSKYPVTLKEVDKKFLTAGIDRIKANLQSRIKKGNMTLKELGENLSLLNGVLDYESFSDMDMVIEAVSEDIPSKQQIFADLEKYCPQHCIFASNTSTTINLKLICERTNSHDRIGFAINRMIYPYTQAALMLVEHGADIYQIDQAVTKFGMPMGPFRMMDLAGFKVAIAGGIQFIENFPERSYKSMLVSVKLEDNPGGESTSKGFYIYDNKGKAIPDPEVLNYIDKARSITGVTIDSEIMKLSDQDKVEMMLFPVVNEACRLLEEGIVVKASDLDVAAVMGMGFPAYRGGIIFWADSLGSKYVCSRLEEWSNVYGAFFKPCACLAERASKGLSLGGVVHAKSQL